MKRDISIYLKDILENIKLIEKFVNKMSIMILLMTKKLCSYTINRNYWRSCKAYPIL